MIAQKAIRLGWARLIEQTQRAQQDHPTVAAQQTVPLPTQPAAPVPGASADGQS
jgi:hypothetical protein